MNAQFSRTSTAALLAFAVFTLPARGQLGQVGNPCPAGGTSGTVTLSSQIPGPCASAAAVQNLIFQLGPTGTLIIDKACTLAGGLRLPPRFTLAGTGMGSAGVITFTHDGIGISMCQQAPAGYVTVRDLDLYGPGTLHSTGIAIANQNIVHIRRVRISDFHTGLSGVSSYSVFLNGCNISNNRGDNVRIGYNSNGWRIRDGLISQAGAWGINVLGPGDSTPIGPIDTSNDLVIDGVRMESNSGGAIRTNAYGTRIANVRFESNGLGNLQTPHRGLLVDTAGAEARILANIFSSDCIEIRNATAQRAFNIPAVYDTAQCAVFGFTR